jgi:biopolymer transport protein TolR
MATSGNNKGYSKASLTGTGTGTYSHQDFSYVRRKRGRMSSSQADEGDGELNIVPYLDILINLIMFLLVAQATLASLGMIDVTAPSYNTTGVGATPDPTQQAKKLRLTVGIGRDGFYIAARGGVLPGETETTGELTADNVAKLAPTIPKRPDGSYDFARLVQKLRGIKTAFPATSAVFVAAGPATAYEIIVKTLDATREDAQGLLFPNVAFTQIN